MIASLLLALPLAVVEPDGYRLTETTQCFTMYRTTAEGEVKFGNTLQTVEFVDHEGVPALRIVIHQYGGDGAFDMRDTFLLARKDLKPIEFQSRFRSTRGRSHDVDLRYTDDRVAGSRTKNGETAAIDLPLSNPVWEGNLWGLTFAALPLEADAHFELPFYQYDKGIGAFEADVTGSETVATDGGPVEAWVVDAGLVDGAHSRYLIGKSPAIELGYGSAGFRQSPGGDCSHLSAGKRAADGAPESPQG
ncbi:MAG TPA: hypothetical protein VF254_10160 [Gammaproteobacteria bacterium]